MKLRQARYVMLGGFLGAGKTTAVARLARTLTERGLRVGLITNDQSSGLVDTTLLRQGGFAVEEIAGGCFCCRFSSLAQAAERLEQDARPDVFIAEPVGSCTDLVATVSYPLRRLYGERFTLAPLSVLVDPRRAQRVLGLASGRAFSEKVTYVYSKQLEEADILVVNKADTLAPAECRALVAALEERYPRARVLVASARSGEGTEAWFELLLGDEAEVVPTMALDYQRYAEGEALLGWLNVTARLEQAGDERFDANALLVELAGDVQRRLSAAGAEIAHLKTTLDVGAPVGKAGEVVAGRLAALSLTSSDGVLDLREALVGGARGGELIINLRAEAAPELLDEAVAQALAACASARPGLKLTIEHREHFRPAAPRPEHRDRVQAPA